VRDSAKLRRFTSAPPRTEVTVRIPTPPTGRVRVRVVPATDPALRCLLILDTDRVPSSGGRGPTHLTRREREVLSLVADGLTADAAAHRLGLSPRTVHKYLQRVYEKLNVHDRVSAVLRARDLGMLGHASTEGWTPTQLGSRV
jgi:DNA-binding CsgD family transcriptional regulator